MPKEPVLGFYNLHLFCLPAVFISQILSILLPCIIKIGHRFNSISCKSVSTHFKNAEPITAVFGRKSQCRHALFCVLSNSNLHYFVCGATCPVSFPQNFPTLSVSFIFLVLSLQIVAGMYHSS